MTTEQIISDVIPDFNMIWLQEKKATVSSCSVTPIKALQAIVLNYNTLCSPCFDVRCGVAKEAQENEDNTTLVWMELNTHRENNTGNNLVPVNKE